MIAVAPANFAAIISRANARVGRENDKGLRTMISLTKNKASKQASKQASKEARKQGSKEARKQGSGAYPHRLICRWNVSTNA